MSLSIQKLNKLLIDNGVFPDKYYSYNKYILYIECIIVKTGKRFWLNIPEEYKFRSEKISNMYIIKPITLEENDEVVVEEFAKQFNDIDVYNSYEDSESKLDEAFNENNISKQLSENYRYPITVKDIDEDDSKDIKDIKRQVERLRFSIMQTKYSICITYKKYFAILSDKKILVFQIMNNSEIFSKFRQLIVSIDLILFYEKLNRVDSEVSKIKLSIEKILETNYNKNINNINYMMKKGSLVIDKFNNLHEQKDKLDALEEKLGELFRCSYNAEREMLEKISIISKNRNSEGEINSLKRKIKETEDVKMNILNNIVKINEKKDNISLTLDKILFDNIVMMNSIIKNFELLLSFGGVI